MASVFDRLANEISSEERLAMLRKISSNQYSEPMHEDEEADNAQLFIEREFSELPFWDRLLIFLRHIFTGHPRTKLTGDFLLRRIQKKVERTAPGLVDYRKNLISQKMYSSVSELDSAMDVFRGPLIQAMEGNQPDFYALLGKLELEDTENRLEAEPDPVKLAQASPDASPVDIKHQMEKLFAKILDDIVPDQRQAMRDHTKALNRLKKLAAFKYSRILNQFPPADQGAGGSASLIKLRKPLTELGSLLYAFESPPADSLLSMLFFFELQNSAAGEGEWFETEISERMTRASAALNTIRNINTGIPWLHLMKTLEENVQFMPAPGGNGENWYRVFHNFWKKRLTFRYQSWADKKRLSELTSELKTVWKENNIDPVPGYRNEDYPENIRPKYELTFAAVRTLFLDVFQTRMYHVLNIIMANGKFYKKNNRKEYEEIFGKFQNYPRMIRSFEKDISNTKTSAAAAANSPADFARTARGILRDMDKECQKIIVQVLEDLNTMSLLLKGILRGNGGAYDTISNMSEIGGQRHDIFYLNLEEVSVITEGSSKKLSDLLLLEDKGLIH